MFRYNILICWNAFCCWIFCWIFVWWFQILIWKCIVVYVILVVDSTTCCVCSPCSGSFCHYSECASFHSVSSPTGMESEVDTPKYVPFRFSLFLFIFYVPNIFTFFIYHWLTYIPTSYKNKGMSSKVMQVITGRIKKKLFICIRTLLGFVPKEWSRSRSIFCQIQIWGVARKVSSFFYFLEMLKQPISVALRCI